MRSRILVVFSLMIVPVLVVMPQASAHEGHSHDAQTREQEAATSQNAARLGASQKRVCEVRSAAIKALMQRSLQRAENYGEFFTTATQRVKTFVENQQQAVDPKLIDAVEAAQATFEADLSIMESKAVFGCDSDSPKGQLQAFQESHRQIMHDLKDWRAALKNLMQPYKTDRTTE